MPQVGLPQNDPVTIDTIAKTHPSGAKLFAIKDIILILKIKFIIENKPINPKHKSEMKEEGTCTYIILTESPWI